MQSNIDQQEAVKGMVVLDHVPEGWKVVDGCTNAPAVISRQAAIDATKKHYRAHDNDLLELIAFDIEQLPSVQPEIIRCKDCKWYGRADKRRFYRGMDCLQKRIDTIVPDKDFCSRAERRTDE